MYMFEFTFAAWKSWPPHVTGPPSALAGWQVPSALQVEPGLQPDVRQSFTHRPRESHSWLAAQSAFAPHPSWGTQPPTLEHFSPVLQSAAVVHLAEQVPLPRHTAVLPQLPAPWQLCAQVPAPVHDWPEPQSASAPQPVLGTQPPEVEHFSEGVQLASVVHLCAHVFVARHVNDPPQSVPDWHCAPTAPTQLQALKPSAAVATRSNSHREL
jgi:hypothetical protein